MDLYIAKIANALFDMECKTPKGETVMVDFYVGCAVSTEIPPENLVGLWVEIPDDTPLDDRTNSTYLPVSAKILTRAERRGERRTSCIHT